MQPLERPERAVATMGPTEETTHEHSGSAPASGSGLAIGGLATPQSPMLAWPTTWGKEIDEYVDELTDRTLKSYLKTFVGLGPALEELRDKLKDPAVGATACRAALEKVRTACRKEGAHEASSSFPTNTENNLIEYVNAKLLWEHGDTSLVPGATVLTKNKKGVPNSPMNPDYLAGGGAVGDCVRIKKPTASADVLIKHIGSDVTDKLTTYPELNVRVVVDMTGSGPGAASLTTDLDDTKKKIVAQLKGIDHSIISRMTRLDVALPGDILVTIAATDLV